MNCKRHPKIETALTCGKCGDPICPRCMVQTPVGLRCPACANVRRVPTYQVSGGHYLRAVGAAVGVAVVTGIVWGFLQAVVPFIYLSILIAGAAGFAIGEGISLSVNRKAGVGLAVIGGLAVVSSYSIATFVFPGGFFSLFDLVALGVGIFVAVSRLK